MKGKRIVSVLVVACLLLCFGGCSKEPATLVGRWHCQVNLSETINQMVGGLIEFGEDLDPVSVAFDVQFNEDGTFFVIYDQEHIAQQINNFIDSAWNTVVYQLAEEADKPVAEIEKALEEKGLTKEILKQTLDLGSMFAEFADVDGYWKLDGNQLYLSTDPDDLDDVTPVEIRLRADSFTVGGLETMLIPGLRQAATFYRVEAEEPET